MGKSSNRGFFKLLKTAFFGKGAAKLAASNCLRDKFEIMGKDKKFAKLHDELHCMLDESYEKWDSYDYGEGYFYQSYAPCYITGFRNTARRFKNYRLGDILKSDFHVLDVGCNSGFLSLEIARKCAHVDAFDLNPYLIKLAEVTAKFEGIENASFYACDLAGLPEKHLYDVVLSFANHHTFDGNMRPEFRTYMQDLRNCTKDGGLLIFESHPNEHASVDENTDGNWQDKQSEMLLKEQLLSVSDIWEIESEKDTQNSNDYFDNNRLIVWMRAK